MKKYTKERMITDLMDRTGCSEVHAIKMVTNILEGVEEALLREETVLLSGIGTIEPVVKEERVKELFGNKVELGRKLKLTLSTSRVLNDKYLKRVTALNLKKVEDLFLLGKK